jgi:tetratricopeptide (TPR) repeat protein
MSKTNTNRVEKLESLIKQAKVKVCLDLLTDFFRDNDKDIHIQCIDLQGRLTFLENQERDGTISGDESILEENRIRQSVTNIIFDNIKPSDDASFQKLDLALADLQKAGQLKDDVSEEQELADDIAEIDSKVTQVLTIVRHKEVSDDWVTQLMDGKNARKLWLMSIFSMAVLVGLYFFYKKDPQPIGLTPDNRKLDSILHPIIHVTLSLGDRYENAENLRSNNQLDEAINGCDSILQIEHCYWKALNLKAECLMIKAVKEHDNLPELENAVVYARKAIKCNPADKDGYIYSTLAQIYGEMRSDASFYKYLDSTLTRGVRVWDYLDQPGFSKYRNELRFKKKIAFAKIQ